MAKRFRGSVLIAALGLCGLMATSLATPAAAVVNKNNKIAILYDQGGRGDHALNDAVAVGVDLIKKRYGLTSLNVREMVTTGTDADRYSRLLFLAKANYSLILAVGNSFDSVLGQAAIACPYSQFAIINDETVASLNVSDLSFDGAQGAYLAGVLAGAATKSLKVGFLAPSAAAAWYPAFVQGVAASNKKARAYSEITDTSAVGQTKTLYAQGVDVLFSEVSSTSDVADTAATLSTKLHPLNLIGISPDQYFLLQKNTSALLLGAVTKRVDIATEDVMTAALNGITVNDVLNESAGIFGRLYTVPGGGESIALTGLGEKYAAPVGSALAALKSGKVKL